MAQDRTRLFLFDVDGTLTEPRKIITQEMKDFMKRLNEKVVVALVGGSDLKKIDEQMGGEALSMFEFVFSENGLVYHRNGEHVSTRCIQDEMGDEKLQKFINYSLRYMSDIQLPVKRGTFIEFRKGLINVCPVGRSCSQAERDQFGQYDKEHQIRQKFVADLQKQFPDLGLVYSIGGQISFDVFPEGWDKRYCLNHILVEGHKYDEILFFGDKTMPGGNDHELFKDPRVKGHTVTSPADTREQVSNKLLS